MDVTNVRVKYLRPRYQDLAEWCSDPANVYVGRRGVVFVRGERFPARDSPFANPFKIGRDGDRATVLRKYKEYITQRPDLMAMLPELRGKRLGCWCAPELCHADVLIELLNQQSA